MLLLDVDYAFQALALDEQRLTFSPTLWHKTENSPAKDLQQCWFPGVHGNIGGQAEFWRELGDHEEIGDNTFAWMVSPIIIPIVTTANDGSLRCRWTTSTECSLSMKKPSSLL